MKDIQEIFRRLRSLAEYRKSVVLEFKRSSDAGTSVCSRLNTIARKNSISPSTLRRWVKREEQTRDVARKKRSPTLGENACNLLWTWLTENNRLAVKELQHRLQKEGYEASQTGIRRCLKRIGIIRRGVHWRKHDAVCKFARNCLAQNENLSLEQLHGLFMNEKAWKGFNIPISLFSRRLVEAGFTFRNGKWGNTGKPLENHEANNDQEDDNWLWHFNDEHFGITQDYKAQDYEDD